MELNIIGNRGAFPLEGKGTSCYLIKDKDTNICLDFGSSALANIQSKIDIEEIDSIILTHLHYDHIVDIFTLSYLLGLKKIERKIDVYLPNDNSNMYNILKNIPEFNLIDIEENREYIIKNFKISFIEMKHKVKTYGVRVSNGNGVLAYTADTVLNDNLPKLLYNADIALCDTCTLDKNYKEGSPHISVKDMAIECNKANVKKMLLTHFVLDDEREILKEVVQKFKEAYITKIGDTYII